MTDRLATNAIALAAILGAGCALAQSGPPVADVGPPPAESRDSAGAILLDDSPVRTERVAAPDPAAATRTMGNVGQPPDRTLIKRRMRDDLARQGASEARELRLRGAGSLISR